MKKTPQLQFTPEQELLLWSIRVDHTKDQEIADILSKKVDWNYVRETAIQHGIIPLLYKRLKEEMSDLVPSHELLELQILFMANAAQNLQMTQQLIRVLDLLANAGIEAMPFKGPALAVQAYGDLSMRSFCDLDILIHEGDFDRAYNTLSILEFTSQNLIDSNVKKKLTKLEKDLLFYGNGICLEIHWDVIEPLFSIPLNQDDLWRRPVSIPMNGRNVKTLSLEDTLLVLCIHGNKHFWQELKWLADVTNIIKNNPDLNLQTIINQADLLGVRRMVGITLLLAETECGMNFPPDIENLLNSDMRIFPLSKKIKSRFFKPLNTTLFSVPPIFYLKSRERMKDQVKYIFNSFTKRLFIPDSFDFNYILLPEILFPFYGIIRPFRLFTGYFRFLFSLFIRSQNPRAELLCRNELK